MTSYAAHQEHYVFETGQSKVSLTYPQVVRLGKILSALRVEGVANESATIVGEDNEILTVMRIEEVEAQNAN